MQDIQRLVCVLTFVFFLDSYQGPFQVSAGVCALHDRFCIR